LKSELKTSFFRTASSFSSEKRSSKAATVAVALGNFDAVHLGHQKLISEIGHADYRVVLSLRPHPKKIFSEKNFKLVSSLEEKLEALASSGCTHYVEERFSPDFRELEPEEFLNMVIKNKLSASRVVIGEDYKFGRERAGNATSVVDFGNNNGFETVVVSDLNCQEEERISTGRIKDLLQAGQVKEAGKMLGRDYSMIGKVVSGGRRGSSITGFPTVNFKRKCSLISPADGVYISLLQDTEGMWYPAVTNIGIRPTISGEERFIESHLIDQDLPELYGIKLRLRLKKRLREEKKFSSVEELKKAIAADVEQARSWFKKNG